MRDFPRHLRRLLEMTTLFPGEDILFEVFLNPASGALAVPKKSEKLLNAMETLMYRYSGEGEYGRSAPERKITVNLHSTRSREETLAAQKESVRRLADFPGRGVLVLAGGDGFHKDAVSALIKEKPELFDRFLLYRLPLGTGNDTPLETNLIKALEKLFTTDPVTRDSLIKVSVPGRESEYALNVASFGLDAYVCLLTEKWKGQIPGDIYKVMVDLSTLFYDFYHRTRQSDLTVYDEEGNVIKRIKKRVLLNVFGRSGHTTYGGDKKILPAGENLMVTGFFHTPGRILIKGLFMDGRHYDKNIKRLDFYRAGKTVLDYPAPLLMELDGELRKLGKDNFPVTLEKICDFLRVIN